MANNIDSSRLQPPVPGIDPDSDRGLSDTPVPSREPASVREPALSTPGAVIPSVPGSRNRPNQPAVPVIPAAPDFPSQSGSPSGNTGSCPFCSSPNGFWGWAVVNPMFTGLNTIAQIRFYNVMSLREPVDVYINNQLSAQDLDYMEYTDYLYILPGYYNISVYRRANPGTAIINTTIRFRRGTSCTVTILGDAQSNEYSLQQICS